MAGRLQIYQTDAITVTFDPDVCTHSAVCLRTLPAVFDVRRRRWIRPELATAEAVADAVRKCPSGALRFRRPGEPELTPAGPADETAADGTAPADGATAGITAPVARVELRPDGPLFVAGPVVIVLPDGTEVRREGASLCRCGASATKPFCDGSHARAGFRA